MNLELWPSENSSATQFDQCKLNMELTWKYSVVPYIKNALTYETGIDRNVDLKLHQLWEDFLTLIFPPSSEGDDDNEFLM